jgi:hypothetical protein
VTTVTYTFTAPIVATYQSGYIVARIGYNDSGDSRIEYQSPKGWTLCDSDATFYTSAESADTAAKAVYTPGRQRGSALIGFLILALLIVALGASIATRLSCDSAASNVPTVDSADDIYDINGQGGYNA